MVFYAMMCSIVLCYCLMLSCVLLCLVFYCCMFFLLYVLMLSFCLPPSFLLLLPLLFPSLTLSPHCPSLPDHYPLRLRLTSTHTSTLPLSTLLLSTIQSEPSTPTLLISIRSHLSIYPSSLTIPPPSDHLPDPYAYRKAEQYQPECYHFPLIITYENQHSRKLFRL